MPEFTGKRQKRSVDKPDGSRTLVRPAYDPREFTFPARELEHFDHIRNNSGTYDGSEDVLDEYDGVLSHYHQIRRFDRDGKRWILLQHPSEYAVEVELTRRQLGETRYPIEVEPGSALP